MIKKTIEFQTGIGKRSNKGKDRLSSKNQLSF